MSNVKEHELLCIICPKGCNIKVVENNDELSFHSEGMCKRGEVYARQEIYKPERVLTTTVEINSVDFGMLPVRTAAPIPKDKQDIAMEEIASIKVDVPVKLGDVIAKDVANTSIELIASRTITE